MENQNQEAQKGAMYSTRSWVTYSRKNLAIALAAGAAVAVCMYFIYAAFAATTGISYEAESGTLAGGASVGSMTSASGGKYVTLVTAAASDPSTATNEVPTTLSRFPGDPNVKQSGKSFFGAAGENAAAHETATDKPLPLDWAPTSEWADRSNLVEYTKAAHAKGRLPWVSFKAPSWQAVAAGTHDADLDRFLRNLDTAANGDPVWLTVDPAMEDKTKDAGDFTAASYRAMQKKVRARMDVVGVNNVAFMPVFETTSFEANSGRNPNDWFVAGVWDAIGFNFLPDNGSELIRPRFVEAVKWAESKSRPYAVARWGTVDNGDPALAAREMKAFWDWGFANKKDFVGMSYFDASAGTFGLAGERLKAFRSILREDDARVMRMSELGNGESVTTLHSSVKSSIDVTAAGSHKVWARIQTPEPSVNSFGVSIDGGALTTVSAGSIAANTWKWVAAPAAVNLTQGAHTVKLRSIGSGVKVDRVLLLTDQNCVPTNLGGNCLGSSTDTVKPVASITDPGNSSTVSGVVEVEAEATDNVKVTKVEFLVNGQVKDSKTTAASPYTFSWTSTSVANGTHTLKVKAYDAAGNVGESTGVTVTVKNGGTTGTVQPIAAKKLMNGVGIDVHANFGGVWAGSNADAFFQKLSATGVTYVRGMIVPGSAQTETYAKAMRKYGIKWEMTVAPTASNPTPAEVTAKVKKIAADYADLCVGLEGMNEPNHNRWGGKVRPDWVQYTVSIQKAIWETAKAEPKLANVPIQGPALHAIQADNHPEQWMQLKNAGILKYQDYAGMHSYPGGYTPKTNLDRRLADMRKAYGANYPAWVTETGYSNNLGGRGNPVTEATSATYIPRMFLELNLDMNTRVGYYEGLNDPGSATEREYHFGWWRTPQHAASSWTAKPTVNAVGSVFKDLKEPDTVGNYTPVAVQLKVNAPTADVKWYVVATKEQSAAGKASVLIYRNLPVNVKSATEKNVSVAPVNVTITDRQGSRVVPVNANVSKIDLR